MHKKVGSKFKGGLEGKGLETIEKIKWNNQGKEGNKVTDCFSSCILKCRLIGFQARKVSGPVGFQ